MLNSSHETKEFALIGASGYIAPRHMHAIHETQNLLIAALDPNDSVGIIDQYFPEAYFFTEFERFDRFIDKRRRSGRSIDYVSICSPNYLHDSHIRFALRAGATAICEKPVVLNPWNIDALEDLERDTERRVFTILQLRVHPAIMQLREKLRSESGKIHDIDLTYITSRGRWYHQSWKGNESKSGGISTNIGVHLFDMLSFLFGKVQSNHVHLHQPERAAGYMEYERARVRWFLSTEYQDMPERTRLTGQRTYRSILMDGEEVEFSGGFADLHTRCYEEILAGRGYGLADSRPAIEAVAHIRSAKISSRGERHPLVAGADSQVHSD
jgi:UDP-N-acetyl-2-amino-2-deoxyglucuronate dehydrogenase